MTVRFRPALSTVLAVLLVVGCAHDYVPVETDPDNPLSGADARSGDDVRVTLEDGRALEGRLVYLGSGRYRIGDAEIAASDVITVERKQGRTVPVLVLAGFGIVVLAVVALASAFDAPTFD